MKIILSLTLDKNNIVKDYAPSFLSFIKNALSKYDLDLYNRIYGDENIHEKDFCFAVRFDKPNFTKEKDEIILNSGNVKMILCIYNSAEAIDFYNAFLAQKGKSYPFPKGNSIVIENVEIKNERKILSEQIIIKMTSPLLVRKHENGRDNYLTFCDDDFQKYFTMSLQKMFSNLGIGELNSSVDIIPFKPVKTVVNTFGNKITGNVGLYILRGDKEILTALQSLGIGSRRSQGFGLFEVLQEVR